MDGMQTTCVHLLASKIQRPTSNVQRPSPSVHLHALLGAASPQSLGGQSLAAHGAFVDDVPVKRASRSPALPEIDTAEGFLPHSFHRLHRRWAFVVVRRY